MKTTTKILIPVVSAALLAPLPALAAGASAHRATAAACPLKVSYDPLSEQVTPRSRYIQLQPNRIDTIIDATDTVTTSYRWVWKPLRGAHICEFSYSQNGVLKHPKVIRDPTGGTYSVTFPWQRGVGAEKVFVTARR